MSDPRWERIKAIFHAVSAAPLSERAALLDHECGEDQELRHEVETLLKSRDKDPLATGDAPRALFPPLGRDGVGPDDERPAAALPHLDKGRVRAGSDEEQGTRAANDSTQAGPTSEKSGTQIGPYRLLEKIGEGGFGEVWVAEQKSPVRRKVALKIVKAGMDTREVLARFEAERQALAMMDHPNIAKVFDAGATPGGRPYFVMEHVAGLPIIDYCDSARLKIRDRLDLFIDICNAVQHAHQKGVIHRDLKPTNILVTLQDNVNASTSSSHRSDQPAPRPIPKVIDFGIAKATIGRLTDRTLYTETGRFIGTPEYMAPEQVGTSGLDVDTRADIYSLGVILYQLLTGTLPFDTKTLRGAGWDGLAKMIREAEPPKPSTRLSTLATEAVNRKNGGAPETISKTRDTDFRALQRELRGDLDWITLKALEKDRGRRYDTASGFAADVRRHLSGEPVIAAPPSAGYRLKKFVKRYKGPMIAGSMIAAVLIIAVVVLTGVTKWALRERDKATLAEQNQSRAREEAVSLKEQADKAADAAEWEVYRANISAAQIAMAANSWTEARRQLSECAPHKRGWEWNFLRLKADSIYAAIPNSNTAVFNKDGTRILTASSEALIWDLQGRLIGDPMPGALSAIFSPDEKLVLTCPGIRQYGLTKVIDLQRAAVRLWDTASHRSVGEALWHDQGVYSAIFSPDGKRVLTVSNDNIARIWEVASHRPIGKPMQHQNEIISAIFNSEGNRILTLSEDTEARLWDAATGTQIGHAFPSSQSAIFSPDGKRILTCSGRGYEGESVVSGFSTRLWDAISGAPVGGPMQHAGERVYSAAFSQNGKFALTRGSDSLRLWDLNGQAVGTIRCGSSTLYSAIVSPDSTCIMTTSADNTARLWALSGEPIGRPMRHPGEMQASVFTPDGSKVLTVCADNKWYSALLWDLSGRCLGVANLGNVRIDDSDDWYSDEILSLGHSETVVLFSPDNKFVLFKSSLSAPILLLSLTQFDTPERCLATPADVEMETLLLFNNTLDKEQCRSKVKLLEHTDGPVEAIVEGGILHQSFYLHDVEGPVAAATLTPDSSRLITASKDGIVRFWETSSGRQTAVFRLERSIANLRFTEDGTRLLITLTDKSALMWDARESLARQVERDSRDIERKPAEAYVDELLAGSKKDEELEASVRNDTSIAPLRRFVGIEILRERMNKADAEAQKAFDAITRQHLTRARANAAAQQWRAPPEMTPSYASRIRKALLKRAVNWKPDADTLKGFAWNTAQQQEESPDRIAAALEAAQEAVQLKPDNNDYLTTLAAVLYRAGKFEEALKTLKKSEKPSTNPTPSNLAIIALCQYRLDQTEKTKSTLSHLKEIMIKNRIEGRVLGDKFNFRYSEQERHGKGIFELSSDGRSFNGKWREDGNKAWRNWNGKREGSPWPEHFDGIWSTDGGNMWITSQDDDLIGFYGIEGFVWEALAGIEEEQSSSAIKSKTSLEFRQWASQVIEKSTEFGSSSWAATQALGKPSTFEYGDMGSAWAPQAASAGMQFISLAFEKPVYATGVTVRETSCNGFVTQIDAIDEANNLHTVWKGIDPSRPGTPVDFFVEFSQTDYLVNGIKIYIDTDHEPGWEEIDAVRLHGIIPDATSLSASQPASAPSTQPVSHPTHTEQK